MLNGIIIILLSRLIVHIINYEGNFVNRSIKQRGCAKGLFIWEIYTLRDVPDVPKNDIKKIY